MDPKLAVKIAGDVMQPDANRYLETSTMSDKMRPVWNPGDHVPIRGAGSSVSAVGGLYLKDGEGIGRYFSKDGHTYLCNHSMAASMAGSEEVDLNLRDGGQHTGGVWSVNFHPATGV